MEGGTHQRGRGGTESSGADAVGTVSFLRGLGGSSAVL